MIDVEVEIFNEVYPYLENMLPVGGFSNEFNPHPASLPYVYLAEIDNYPDRRTADSGTKEYSCVLVYEAQVFALSKQECRDIQAALDQGMIGRLGFQKTSSNQVNNFADETVYRFVTRYRRGVFQDGILYDP